MHETLCQVYEMVFVLLGQGERLKNIGFPVPHNDDSTMGDGGARTNLYQRGLLRLRSLEDYIALPDIFNSLCTCCHGLHNH